MTLKPFEDQKGQVLVMTVVSLVMLLGIVALAIDASFMYDKRNELHAAADAAAKVGAIELRRNSGATITELKRFADEQVNALGLSAAACGATSGASVCINHPPVNGPFNCTNLPGDCNSFVEAIVSQQTGTFFARILGRLTMTPAARAVAGVSPGPNCMVVFDHVTYSNPATGSYVHMDDCSLVVNGDGSPPYDIDNRATIYANTIGVVHTATGCNTSHDCTYNDHGTITPITKGVARATDPLATLPPLQPPPLQSPPLPAPTCTPATRPSYSADKTIFVANVDDYYCGFEVVGSGFPGTVITFETGKNFYINGTISDKLGNSIVLQGTDVMLFLSSSALLQFDMSNNVTIQMTAATSGTYNGILFYQDRTTPTGTLAIFGKNNTFIAAKGAFYFPTATIQMNNENSPTLTNPCMVIVAWAIEVDKPHFELNNSCLGFSGSPLMSLAIVE
jgi:Flp pilus assembly protein TadG